MILAIQTSSSLVMTKYFVCLFLNENGRHNSGDRKKRYYVVQLWRQCFSLHFKALIFPLREWKFKKEVEVVICQFPRRVTSTVHFTDQHLIFIFNLFLPTLLIFEVIIEEACYHNGFFGIFTFTSNVGLCYKTWPRATPPLFADTSVKKIISIFNPFSWAKCWARFTYQCRAETGSVEMEK